MTALDLDALLVHRLSNDRWGWDSVWLETEGGAALDVLIQSLREAERVRDRFKADYLAAAAERNQLKHRAEVAEARIAQLERVREAARELTNPARRIATVGFADGRRSVASNQFYAALDMLDAALAAVEEPASR